MSPAVQVSGLNIAFRAHLDRRRAPPAQTALARRFTRSRRSRRRSGTASTTLPPPSDSNATWGTMARTAGQRGEGREAGRVLFLCSQGMLICLQEQQHAQPSDQRQAAAQVSSSTLMHAPLTCCCIPQEAAVAHVLAQARGPVQHHCSLTAGAGLFSASMPAAGSYLAGGRGS